MNTCPVLWCDVFCYVLMCSVVGGCVLLCSVVGGCVLLCSVVFGCVLLCTVVICCGRRKERIVFSCLCGLCCFLLAVRFGDIGKWLSLTSRR